MRFGNISDTQKSGPKMQLVSRLVRHKLLLAAAIAGLVGAVGVVCLADGPVDIEVAETGILDPVLASAVTQLVELLDSPLGSERALAERRLRNLGPQILTSLTELAAGELSVRARDALSRIRAELERAQAELTAQAALVTLVGRFTLAELCTEIERQTGNRVQADPALAAESGVFSLDWRGRTFWEVMTALHQEHDLWWEDRAGTGLPRLELRRASPDETPASVPAGAFRVVIDRVEVRPDFTDSKRKIVRAGFVLEAEPRLRPLYIQIADSDFSCRVNERSLSTLNPDARRELPISRQGTASFSIDFMIETDDSVDQVTVSGELEVELALAEQRFVFNRLEDPKPLKQRHGGVTVSLEELEAGRQSDAGRVTRVLLGVVYDDEGPLFESHRSWVLHNDVYLVGADGRTRRAARKSQIREQRDSGAVVEYEFVDGSGEDDTRQLVALVPTKFLTAAVSFESATLRVSSDDLEFGNSP